MLPIYSAETITHLLVLAFFFNTGMVSGAYLADATNEFWLCSLVILFLLLLGCVRYKRWWDNQEITLHDVVILKDLTERNEKYETLDHLRKKLNCSLISNSELQYWITSLNREIVSKNRDLLLSEARKL